MEEAKRQVWLVGRPGDPLLPSSNSLRRDHLEVSTFTSSEAVAALSVDAGRVDLLIVVLDPSDMAAFEAVRALRRAGREIPVLALSVAFERRHIEGMLANLRVRRLFGGKLRPEELRFWVNYELFPEVRRSRRVPRAPSFAATHGHEVVNEVEAITNLSEDGLFLETDRTACIGDVLRVAFGLPGADTGGPETMEVRCQVVWANPPPPRGQGPGPHGLGLRFVDLAEPERQKIGAYVLGRVLDDSI